MDRYFISADDVKKTYDIDIVTAESIRNGLIQITRQMQVTLVRGALTPYVRDMMDMATCIHRLTEEGSELIAITEGCVQHAFTQGPLVSHILREWGVENFQEGDVVFTNDSFRGSLHFCDVNCVRLCFWEGKPVFVLSDTSHIADMGGNTAGGVTPGATVYFQEGIRVPPMLLYANDIPVRSTFNLLLENCRTPYLNLGDLRALYGTLSIGERLLHSLIKRWGLDNVLAAARYTLDHAERKARSALSEIPDGIYEATEFLDDDGIEDKPVKIHCAISIRGDNAEIDFSGSAVQCLGYIGSGWADAFRCALGIKLFIDPGTPMNSGFLRPFDAIVPPGSVVCKLPPGSIAEHSQLGNRTVSAAARALSLALPERGFADESATLTSTHFEGFDDRHGKGNPFTTGIITPAGWGATYKSDGVSYCAVAIANCYDYIVEFLEQEYPLVVLEREFVIDSGGPGKYRGGLATYVTLLALADQEFNLWAENYRGAALGVHGGGNGKPGYTTFIEGTDPTNLPTWEGITPSKYFKPFCGTFDKDKRPDPINGKYGLGCISWSDKSIRVRFPKGAIFRTVVPGAGGYGNPLERDADKVAQDVRNRFVSVAAAEESYGVIIDPCSLQINKEATASKRKELSEKQAKGEWQVSVAHHPVYPLETLDEIVEIKESRR